MKTIVVIPARFKSSRFPGKPLIKLLGKPMIQWVAELSSKAVNQENVFIGTEDKKIYNAVTQMGFKAIMTSNKCLTGTDRIAEIAKKIKADIYINVQGDEPLINPNDIQKIIKAKKKYPKDVINAYTVIKNNEDPNNVNKPKVIFTKDKRLVYISRKAIPGYKEKKMHQMFIISKYVFMLLIVKNYLHMVNIIAKVYWKDVRILKFFAFLSGVKIFVL